MSLTLSTAYVTLFDSEVKQAYQASSVLRDTVRLRSGVEGNTYKFPKIGKGSAIPESKSWVPIAPSKSFISFISYMQ